MTGFDFDEKSQISVLGQIEMARLASRTSRDNRTENETDNAILTSQCARIVERLQATRCTEHFAQDDRLANAAAGAEQRA